MHEAMVAQSLLAAISAEAAKVNARPIAAKVTCGQLYAVNEEVLRFAFEALAKGTPCENVKIHLEQIPLQAKCKNCDKTFNADVDSPACPNCGSGSFQLLGDAPMLLEEIELQETSKDVQSPAEKEDS